MNAHEVPFADALSRLREWVKGPTMNVYKHPREAKDDIALLLARHDEIERNLRREWWGNHGHDFNRLYGDDGEMQCSACPADFKRDPLDDLWDKVWFARAQRGQQALKAAGLHECQRCGSDKWVYADYGGCSVCRPLEARDE